MSIVSHKSLSLLGQRSLMINQKRFNIRESIRKYVEPNKFKKHMLAATQPYIKKVYQLPEETCKGSIAPEIPIHPLIEIYRKELVEAVQTSDFLLIYQYNFTTFQSDRRYKNDITKAGGFHHIYNNQTYKLAFETLNYHETKNFWITRNAMVTGHIQNLVACLKVILPIREYILLAGYINSQLYEADHLKKIASAPDINICRANLLGTLTSPSITLADHLGQHSLAIGAADSAKDQAKEDNK